MPLEKLVLILVLVIAVAGASIWLGALVFAATELPGTVGLISVPVLLAAYVLWRVISDRLRNAEDDHYDRIEK